MQGRTCGRIGWRSGLNDRGGRGRKRGRESWKRYGREEGRSGSRVGSTGERCRITLRSDSKCALSFVSLPFWSSSESSCDVHSFSMSGTEVVVKVKVWKLRKKQKSSASLSTRENDSRRGWLTSSTKTFAIFCAAFLTFQCFFVCCTSPSSSSPRQDNSLSTSSSRSAIRSCSSSKASAFRTTASTSETESKVRNGRV